MPVNAKMLSFKTGNSDVFIDMPNSNLNEKKIFQSSSQDLRISKHTSC